VDATPIVASSSTKNADGWCYLEMRQGCYAMKTRIGVDAALGLPHAVAGTAANVSDINVAGALLHGKDTRPSVTWTTGVCTSERRPWGRPRTWRCVRANAGG